MIRRFIPLVLWMMILMLPLSGCAKNDVKKPLPKNEAKPEINTLTKASAKDAYNNGCVSCHKKTAEVDRTLPVYVKKIAGHPDVKEATVNACYECHEAEKDFNLYKKFVRATHLSHWRSEVFYTELKGQCYSCHTVENNGVSGLKNYPLAGYRTGVPSAKSGASTAAPAPTPSQGTTKQAPSQGTKQETQSTESKKQQGEQSEETNKLPEEQQTPTPTP